MITKLTPEQEEMITELTPEQEEYMIEFREKWRAIGISTDPADKPRAEEAITKMYEKAQQEKPEFIWRDSPYACNRTINEMAECNLSEYNSGYFVGQLDSYWIALYLFCEEIGVKFTDEQSEVLHLWADIAQSAFWWWPREGYCFISDRPKVLTFDQNLNSPLLHNEIGPSISFRDGYSMYHWHGTEVPSNWIEEKNKVDPMLALNHDNIEQRRCLAEILGWDRVIEKLNPRVIDKHPSPLIGELLEVDLPDAPKEKFLRAQCGTGRVFVLPLGTEDYKTALEANASTYEGLDPQLLEEAVNSGETFRT